MFTPLSMAYRQYGLTDRQVIGSIVPFDILAPLAPHDAIRVIAPTIATRLRAVSPNLAEQLLAEPLMRHIVFDDIEIDIPVLLQSYDEA